MARSAAARAGASTLQYFKKPGLDVQRKGDDSPVTVADRGAEELLRSEIEAAFPDDAILGEEFEEVSGQDGKSQRRRFQPPQQTLIGFVGAYGIAADVVKQGPVHHVERFEALAAVELRGLGLASG